MAEKANPIAVDTMSKELWRSHLAMRRLDNQCAPLRQYLSPGLDVLDVGCGPGSITVDVAAAVKPGHVCGVDLSQDSIRQATELAAASGAEHVTFAVGDGATLQFADGSFELVYSNSLLEWVREPEALLREQRRVARSGGWVIAITNSHAGRAFYPRCPALEKILAASLALAERGRQGVYFNTICSRQTVGMFKAVGFQTLQVQAYGAPIDCVYAGSEFFEYRYESFLKMFADPDHPTVRYGITDGLYDEGTVRQAKCDIDRWHEDPAAFYLQCRLLVAGRCE